MGNERLERKNTGVPPTSASLSRPSRPFPTASPLESIASESIASQSTDQSATPAIQKQAEPKSAVNHTLSNIPIFAAGTTPPPPPDMPPQIAQQMSLLKARSVQVQRQIPAAEPLPIPEHLTLQRQTAPAPEQQTDTTTLETSIQQSRSGGQSMADRIRQPMENAFGANFGGVKIHTDARSDQMNRSIQAKAFTTGQDIFFRQGAYDPGSRNGQELLAHELTHVVQQNGRQVAPVQRKPQISPLNQPLPTVQRWDWDTPEQKAQKQRAWGEAIDREKSTAAQGIATKYIGLLKGELEKALVEGFKGKSKKWGSAIAERISQALQQFAEQQIVKTMETAAQNLDASIFQDAKQYAKQYIASTLFDSAFRDFAQKMVNDPSTMNFTSKTQAFQNAALQIFEAAKAKPGDLSSVKSRADSAAKDLLAPTRHDIKLDLANFVLQNENYLIGQLQNIVKTKLGNAGTEEVDRRQQADGTLLGTNSGEWLEAIYQTKIFKPLEVYLADKFGSDGMGFWSFRSTEALAFREQMKKAGREKVYQEISEKVHTHESTKEKSVNAKNYFETKAKDYAYVESKKSINAMMKDLATAEVKDLLEKTPAAKQSLIKQLTLAAKTSAYDAKRSNGTKFVDVGQTAAAIEATKICAAKKLLAQERKNAYFAKSNTLSTDNTLLSTTDQFKQNVSDRVTRDNVAETSIKLAVEADTMGQGLTKIGKLIDMAAPNPGDKCATKIQIKIPVWESGAGQEAYVILEFNGEAEREAGELEVKAELTLGVGFETWGLDVSLQAGMGLAAKGRTTADVTNLLSYGAYRAFKAKSETAAYKLWGGTSKRQDKENSANASRDNAEQWANMIEESTLKEMAPFQDSTDEPIQPTDEGKLVYFKDAARTIVTLNRQPPQTSNAQTSNAQTPSTPAPDRDLAGIIQNVDKKYQGNKQRIWVNRGNRDAFVETAYLAKLNAEVNAGVFEAEGQLKGSSRNRWTGSGVEQRKSLSVEGKGTFKIGGNGVAIGAEIGASWSPQELKSLEATVKGQLIVAMGEDATQVSKIAVEYGTNAAAKLRNLVNAIRRALDKQDPQRGTKTAANALSLLVKTGGTLSNLEGGKEITESILSSLGKKDQTVNDTIRSMAPQESMSTSAIEKVNRLTSETALEVAIKLGYERGDDGGEWECDISINRVKTNKVDLGVFTAEVERSERLGRFNFGSNGVKGGLLGFERP